MIAINRVRPVVPSHPGESRIAEARTATNFFDINVVLIICKIS